MNSNLYFDEIENFFVHSENGHEIPLKFLYTLYNRVDLFKTDGSEIKNIYVNSDQYSETFTTYPVETAIEIFAEKNIHSDDREKFKKFLNLKTMEARINKAGGNYIIDCFRALNENHNFNWQVFMFMPITYNGEKYFLCCVRDIDFDKLKRLSEIDSEGKKYYDMPGNPLFLLLASHAFTSILGYGSFENFLYNSFYLEVNLTADKILYVHLKTQDLINIKTSYKAMTYGEIVHNGIIFNNVIDDFQNDVEKFFNRERLLEEYRRGNFFHETEFLIKADSEPRYLHVVCQIRKSTESDEIHAFFLVFDIDNYRRNSEQIKNLIERDALTGLYNRRSANLMIKEFLSDENIFAFIILDLDNFKNINDRFGHDCGDKIIKNATFKMREHFSRYGFIARLGGDEFLVVLRNLNLDEIENCLKNFVADKKFIEYEGQKITYTMSIGYSTFPAQGQSYHELYKNADMALYAVKMTGRNHYKKFSPQMIEDNRAHLGVSLSQISEGMPGGFLLYRDNDEQEILYANKRLWKIYECESLEEFRKFTGNSFRGCVHPDDWDKIQRTIYEQVEISEGYDYVRYRIKTAKGNIKVIEDFGRLVHSKNDGNIFYVFMIDFEAKEKLWSTIT